MKTFKLKRTNNKIDFRDGTKLIKNRTIYLFNNQEVVKYNNHAYYLIRKSHENELSIVTLY